MLKFGLENRPFLEGYGKVPANIQYDLTRYAAKDIVCFRSGDHCSLEYPEEITGSSLQSDPIANEDCLSGSAVSGLLAGQDICDQAHRFNVTSCPALIRDQDNADAILECSSWWRKGASCCIDCERDFRRGKEMYLTPSGKESEGQKAVLGKWAPITLRTL